MSLTGPNITSFKKKDPRLMGENNPNWKGNKVKYIALHSWVNRTLGKATYCSNDSKHFSKKYEWANIDHKYSRNVKDYKQLCPSCHRKLDMTDETRNRLKTMGLGKKLSPEHKLNISNGVKKHYENL